ncbi:collagen alpha-1(II) chain-like isoform X6 [Branchiostoma floridae]|uniref:Collagen alpha-1(II) chain-like isoform X6 n=1 Tax=Branchiostoma floridae TaxID=7739 RepID=A0A9J7LQR0_BRAFL|nr:collagen alpha-1(II) chain-like isoform X6 [Branchiostoma floridae]
MPEHRDVFLFCFKESTTVSRRSVIPDGVNMASKDTGVKMANGTDELIWITPHICIKKTVAEKTAVQGQKTGGDKTKDAGVVDKKGVQAGSFGTTQKQTEQTSSANTGKGGLESALAGVLHGPTIKGDKASKEKAPIVGPGGIPSEEVRWGSEYVTMKQGDATMQSAAPTQAAATIKSADTTQSAPPPGPGLSAALEGMLHGPTIKGDKASKEKAPIVGPGGIPKEEVRWGSEYVTMKQGDATMQSAAPTQAAATIKSADTTQSAPPPGPGLSAALEGMLHGPTIKGDKASKEKAPIVGPGGIPKEEVRWGSEYVTMKQGDATMQSAAPTQAAATIKSADTTQSAPPPGPGLSAALEGMLHGPTIKGDKASKEKAPIVGPGGIPKEEVRWGSEYVTDKQGAATMQSAAPTQAATIKSADTTQSAPPPGPGLSAALEGMLHGPTIKGDKASKEKAPIVGPGGIPKEEVRWGSEYVTDKQGAATMQSAAPTQAAATIKSADTTQSAPPPGPGLSAALEGMLHGPTIKGDKSSKEKAPIVGPGGIPKEEVRWGSEYVTDKQGAAKMQSAAPTQAATIKSADTTQSAPPPGPGLSAALEGMLHGPTIKGDKASKEKAPIVGPGGIPKEEVRWGSEYVTDKQGAATMQSAAPTQAAATIKSADTTQSAPPPGPGLSTALEGMLHGPTIKDKNEKKKKAPVVGPDSIPTEEVRWGAEYSEKGAKGSEKSKKSGGRKGSGKKKGKK